jgi:hypothetical protein
LVIGPVEEYGPFMVVAAVKRDAIVALVTAAAQEQQAAACQYH